MSTRATYQFTGRHIATVVLYIHHDGYESGASVYFWNAHHCANDHGNFADKFHRANDRAEFTQSHTAHGDTEYRYTFNVDTGELVCSKRTGWDGLTDRDNWRTIYLGPWHEFVNDHCEQIEGFTALRELPGGEYRSPQVWSATQLIAYIEAKQKEADEYAAKYPQWTGNIAGQHAEVKRLRAMLDGYNAAGGVVPGTPQQQAAAGQATH